MTSGELLKYRKGLFIAAGYESLFPGSSRSRFTLTVPEFLFNPQFLKSTVEDIDRGRPALNVDLFLPPAFTSITMT